MSTTAPKTVYLKDYTPPAFLVDTVDLRFELHEDQAEVTARLGLRRNPAAADPGAPLRLDGRNLELVSIARDGRALGAREYAVDDEGLTLAAVPERFALEVTTRVRPQDNTSLEGLYRSGATFCTQCEAEGFRKITFFPDRPDVMARYTTTVVAERARYPVLLSNGNPVARGEAGGGRHWVTWEDPFPKPCYLFALVAGDLGCVEDTFTTASGREVALRLYVEHHNLDRTAHAMASLKKAMRWDESVYGREYDLDVFMIVAVDDFNMGAMENKGLNIFNSKYILARPDTATDADYAGIEGVVGHEYFHNWSGNRVTCRDWFQLSLKEGLTVFRDQEFSADMGSRAVKRIDDVRLLRTGQFPEDAGPMAHPVRPDSYMEISNFYTATVYNKGAEVIRMIHTLLGADAFRRGMNLYFARHDGEAVTTDHFVQAMEDATGTDLRDFRRWYTQAGTPELHARGAYDPPTRTYTLYLRQSCPPTPGQTRKAPLHIPVALGLLDPQGAEIPLRLAGEAAPATETTRIIELRSVEREVRFTDVPAAPVPSLLRGFSAPVKLTAERSDRELGLLLAHDRDPFNRWDAGQELATRLLLRLVDAHRAGRALDVSGALVAGLARTLDDRALDPALVAEILCLPSERYLGEQMQPVDVDAIHAVRRFALGAIGRALGGALRRAYEAGAGDGPYRFEPPEVARRRLRNTCLELLVAGDPQAGPALALAHFEGADNMTDGLAALAVLSVHDIPERRAALDAFEARWADEPLVLDKWFALQASAPLPETLEAVERLMSHRAFSLRNPNRVRALLGAFCHGNPLCFHAADGAGYRFAADQVLALDAANPQVAARLLGAFSRWRRFDEARQGLMRAEIERVLAAPRLSRDSYEVASKALA